MGVGEVSVQKIIVKFGVYLDNPVYGNYKTCRDIHRNASVYRDIERFAGDSSAAQG